MSTIPSAPPPAAAAAPAPAAAPVIASDVPDALRGLPAGTRIEVTTLADLVRGQVQADSRYGTLTLRGGLPALPANSSLTLILTGTPGEGVSFRLFAVNGQPLLLPGGTALPGSALPGAALPGAVLPGGGIPGNGIPGNGLNTPGLTAPGFAGTGLAGTTPGSLPPPGLPGFDPAHGLRQPGSLLQAANQGDAVALSLGKTLTATIITGPQSGPLSAGAALPAAMGTAAPGSAGQTAPAPQTAPLPGAGPSGGALTAHGLFAALRHAAHAVADAATGDHPAPQPSAPSAPLLEPGAQAQVRLTAVQLPDGTRPLTAPPSSGAAPLLSLEGSVTASPGGGTALIQTPQGSLLLDVRSPLPVNSHVTLDVMTVTTPAQAGAAAPALTGTGTAPGFSALSQALDLLAQEDAEAAQALARAIPAPDARMVTTMMAVAGAARSADPRGWLGDRPLKALDRPDGKGRALLKDVEDATRETVRPARDGGGDWRVMNLPFGFGGQIDRITLVTRRTGSEAVEEDGTGSGGGRGGGVRFLFALDLSRLGPMQFDGLYKGGPHGQPGSRRLSLLVRTSRALDPVIRRDILGLFSTSAEAMGLTGSLSFQVAATFPGPVEALPPSLRTAGGAGGFTA